MIPFPTHSKRRRFAGLQIYQNWRRCTFRDASVTTVTSRLRPVFTCSPMPPSKLTARRATTTVEYIRHVYSDYSISCLLVSSKVRVAPLTATSNPRLELMGAVIALHLAEATVRPLGIEIQNVQFWTDSQNVLGWIRNASHHFKPFVTNRVGEIHLVTEPSQWQHVATKNNPADLLTRGLTATQLAKCGLWWNGPPFLIEPEDAWHRHDRDGESDQRPQPSDLPTSAHRPQPFGSETFDGRDGKVRVARVVMGQRSLIRPIAKLCFLLEEVTLTETPTVLQSQSFSFAPFSASFLCYGLFCILFC